MKLEELKIIVTGAASGMGAHFARRLHEAGAKVAVNVSAVQLYNADFVKELHQILLETGLPPRRLEIEITETALVRDFNRALATLRQTSNRRERISKKRKC